MSIVHEIFDALDGSTRIAEGVGLPIQTVNDWKKKGKPEIPPWRREKVLQFALASGKELSPEAIEYLQSDSRSFGQAA